eukprot:COSAG02_NODE_1927_length_10340_cov_2.510497_5_plen_94_part_00
MQFHTEFQYDPAQDRRAAEQVSNGSSWRCGPSWPLWRLGPQLPHGACEGAVVQGSTTGGDGQPSYTVRTVRTQNTDFGVSISKFLYFKLVYIL